MKIILCLLSAFNILSADSTASQEQGILNKIQDLPDFTVRSTKLTAVNILDSILIYEKKNYYYPKAFIGRAIGVLNKGLDTTFYAVTDSVYFSCKHKKKRVTYAPKILKENTTDFIQDHLDSFSRKRIMTVTGLPPLKDFQSVIGGLKKAATRSETLFGVAKQDDRLLHHILIKYRPAGGDAVHSNFMHLSIDRNGWKLMSMELYNFDSKDSFLIRLNDAQSCNAALKELECGINDPAVRSAKFTLHYKTGDDQKLVPSQLKFQDNLYNMAYSLFKRTEDKSGAMYTYDLQFDRYTNELPPGALKDFNSTEWAYQTKVAAAAR